MIRGRERRVFTAARGYWGHRELHAAVTGLTGIPSGKTLPLRSSGHLPAPNFGEVTVDLGHVEAVADDEVRRDLEADVLQVGVLPLQALLHQERADLDARR